MKANSVDLNLTNKEWGEFEIGSLFKIYTGGDLIISKISNGNYPVISHSVTNNGIASWSKELKSRKLFNQNNTISLADRGNFYAFTQMTDFYIGTRVKALEAKFSKPNKEILKFICLCINKQSVKFSYGNNATQGVDKIKILLPINSKNEPDYAFMEQFMRAKEQEKLEQYAKFAHKKLDKLKDYKEVKPLNEKEWSEFFIEDIAEIISGRDIYETERKAGNIPYVSATAQNNGIGYFVGNKNETLEENCLSVNRNGSVGYSFYHPYKALFSNDCRKLRLKHKSRFVGLFISRIITSQKEKYGYGYKMGTARIRRQKILLPINSKNEPDYEYMENYIKKIEFEKLSQYLKYKKI